MPQEYRQALIHQMLAHTEGELMGVAEYLRVALFAPNAHEKMYCYEGARDEMSHYILSAEVLDELGIDTRYMLEKDAERTAYPMDWLAGKVNWPERAITSFMAERGALDIIEEMAQSSYLPWAAIMDQIIEDESRHVEHGRRITEEVCHTAEGCREVQAALERMWPEVLDMFGRSDSERSRVAVRWGLRQRSNEEARAHFAVRARKMLEPLGLRPPSDGLNRKFL